jgi:hypothetical protein
LIDPSIHPSNHPKIIANHRCTPVDENPTYIAQELACCLHVVVVTVVIVPLITKLCPMRGSAFTFVIVVVAA